MSFMCLSSMPFDYYYFFFLQKLSSIPFEKTAVYSLSLLASNFLAPFSICVLFFVRKILLCGYLLMFWLFLGLISFLLSRLYRKISGCSDPEAVTVNCALLPEVDRGHHHRTSKYKDTPEMRQYFYLYHWWFALCL